MARSTVSRERITVIRRYPWPENLLNWWTIVMLATGGLILGVFADFSSIQKQMGLGIPWLFPYAITVGSLTIVYVIILIILTAQKNLNPEFVLLGSFILIALYLTGLIETAIQLFGNGNVNQYCNAYVTNNKITGVSIDTLAWLEQSSICSQWDAAFAFWIIGLVWLIWMMIMASQVMIKNSKHSKSTIRWSYFLKKKRYGCDCEGECMGHRGSYVDGDEIVRGRSGERGVVLVVKDEESKERRNAEVRERRSAEVREVQGLIEEDRYRVEEDNGARRGIRGWQSGWPPGWQWRS